MTIYARTSGVWRTIIQPYVKTSGTWRTIQQQDVKSSGSWRTVFTAGYVPGALWTWGQNFGELGDNTIIDKRTPVTTFAGGTNWKQVSCGGGFTAAIKTDGTLWTWGETNNEGQLGNNTFTDSLTPVTTFAGGTNWKQVNCGGQHMAAVKTDGTLWVWGRNNNGQLGTNNTINRSIPVTTFAGGTNWNQVSAGGYHTAAVKTDGTLWVWGRNSYGQLGTNNTINRSTPVTTFAGGTNWKQVSISGNHSTTIKTDGTLWAWGNNLFGQLGNNTAFNSALTPVTTFAGGTNWKQVECGEVYAAAIKTDGTLWTWGFNVYGALGNNITTESNTPVTTFAGGTNWKQVSASTFHTAAVKTDGTLWTWGYNYRGALGNNTITDSLTPVTTFAGGTTWKSVSTASCTAAIRT